jgi:hypothetical protein
MGMIDSLKHERGLEDGDRYRVDSPPSPNESGQQ